MNGLISKGRLRRPDRRRERGFALLEILVAFVVLAIGLGAISTGVAIAMRSDGRSQSNRIALRLVQSRLEAAGITEALVPGRREGVSNNYKWQQTVTAVDLGGAPREVPDLKSGQPPQRDAIASFWVEVSVEAADGSLARLAALKLASEIKP
jgi:general secretion pathway protein I